MAEAVIAKVVADSISPQGQRITTFELEYPRIIHSELMTHRLFSRNAMSSRAIPIEKMIKQVQDDPAMPVKFGKNQPGMQDAGDHDQDIIELTLGSDGVAKNVKYSPEQWYAKAGIVAAQFAKGFSTAGYHKQIANRLLEPFQRMKTVLTATDFKNFWWLRVDKDADPTIFALAEAMKKAFDESDPEMLEPGQWHTPYVDHLDTVGEQGTGGTFEYCVLDENNKPVILTVEEAKAISASCCAQVSYRVLNNTKDKALDIYGKLLSGNKVHASPFEHQATPMEFPYVDHEESDPLVMFFSGGLAGYTHVDRDGVFWSGNFCGWLQHRQLVPNNVVSG